MHAAAIDRFGGPVLTLYELPVPAVDKGEVLIALHTAGVGSWHAEMRAGWYPGEHPDFPLVLGADGSGKVAAMGSHIRRFRVARPCTLTASRIRRVDFMPNMLQWQRNMRHRSLKDSTCERLDRDHRPDGGSGNR